MEDVSQIVKEIKQSFRQMMDGAVAQSMRDKGLNYHLNWGATLPRLKDRAEEIKSSLITNHLPFTVYDIWMEQVPSQEIAEQVAFNLWQHLPYAPEKAYQWIATDKEYYQLCGFHVLSRLFMNGQEPNERGINEFIDQALAALQGPFMSVRKAAMQSIIRFSELGLVYERLAKSALKSVSLDFF